MFKLGVKLQEGRVALHRTHQPTDTEASVTVTLRETNLLTIEAAMHGRTFFDGPSMEPMTSLIKIWQVKDTFIVEMRHDRLFRPGTAYLRDEALPYLTQATAQLPKDKKILLRSYTEKPLGMSI